MTAHEWTPEELKQLELIQQYDYQYMLEKSRRSMERDVAVRKLRKQFAEAEVEAYRLYRLNRPREPQRMDRFCRQTLSAE